ncbi:hypothetical protein QBC33DRAFT_492712 [Phialemonium atrogriseum]|uniref:polynucleotide adenylyltransferase n=1 Tax=Phialemonium atrogriseum TaxID=1093897 RepID=A0AAJ0FN34_9PEZI|nr:uncharacterized protein QBC33DRAFT_492712 [Phialemonium atrogriseum]KAK1766755.1 hypothetical protein QBC33DRAFT_492712 [Phialemonium atrogriseum]
MAAAETFSDSGAISINSHDTALCFIPDQDDWPSIDRFRALYDKAYGNWPPHVNLVYPFVRPDSLYRAAKLIQDGLQRWKEERGEPSVHISLNAADVFTRRHDNTLFRCDSDSERTSEINKLRRTILQSLGHPEGNYRLHMTVAQSEDVNSSAHKFLLNKIGLMPTLQWDAGTICVLVRERMQIDGSAVSRMKLWGIINLSTGCSLTRHAEPRGFYETGWAASSSSNGGEAGERDQLQTRPPYYLDDETRLWQPFSSSKLDSTEPPKELVVSSYNVLGEFSWPPSQARYPLIIKNILSAQASADVLVLQEATDDFLSYLLKDEGVRKLYPFTSHGPPDQADIEPLPSHLNILVLSRWAFDWEWVSFRRKHKASIVARFKDIGKWEGQVFLPTVLAAVHLTCGLTDGAIADKKIDVQRILKYLSKSYPENPWILTGDFNLSTSSFSIDGALRKKAISAHSAGVLAGFEHMFSQAKLADAWAVSRLEDGDHSGGEQGQVQNQGLAQDVVDGEQGATYDPTVNEVAAGIVGSGYNMRPQRYDRILVRGEGALAISRFNRFGFLKERISSDEGAEPTYASDHWGVRCVMTVRPAELDRLSDEVSSLVVPVHPMPALGRLSGDGAVEDCLEELGLFPSEEEVEKRQSVLDLLKRVLLETQGGGSGDNPSYSKSRASVIIVPVGSYGLGVWTTSSDIDCLCIGPFSAKTFFALASQRLRKASGGGVKVLRRVRANTGTMLELEILGIKVDLQYCPATSIAENWPHALKLPLSNPIWSLPVPTLSKLKAIRDLDYLRRSVPDLDKFRVAHRLIRAWAVSRGIFSAKFGFLGGFHISILLARVYKLLAHDAGSAASPALPVILATFFNHYASFDWKSKMAFDPFFHRQRLPYTRTAREPLAILGYFPPSLNTAHAASALTVRTIAEEFKLADERIRRSPRGGTWTQFLRDGGGGGGGGGGVADFLASYGTYVRVDLQYWGASLSRGIQLAGWLESRLVMLLVDLHRRLPAVHARIWPARFVRESASAAAAGEQQHQQEQQQQHQESAEAAGSCEYQGHYLIGLDRAGGDVQPRISTTTAAAADVEGEGELRSVLRRFEEQIRGDARYFDARSCWVGADLVERGNLDEDMVVDAREWGEYAPGEEETDDDDDNDEEGEEEEEEEDRIWGTEGEEGDGDDDYARRKKNKKNKGRKGAQTPPPLPRMEPGKKLRTAADVMNRLRWDPGLDSGDYVVGYEDRFVGAQEKALDAWRTEQTDEEFIPQHRILYFKRKTDGVLVWEKRTRKDDVFGSGI